MSEKNDKIKTIQKQRTYLTEIFIESYIRFNRINQ